MKFNIVDTLWDHIETPNLVSSYCGPSDDVERLAQLLRDIVPWHPFCLANSPAVNLN